MIGASNNRKSFGPREAGFSLIELMVALALGVVLSFAAVNLFLQTKISYLQDEEMARLQENGRYAMRMLSRELSMAGYYGGVLRGDLISQSLAAGVDCLSYMLDTEAPLEHHNNVTADGVSTLNDPNMPADCRTAGEHMPETDMLVFRRSLDSPHVLDGSEVSSNPPQSDAVYIRKLDHNVSLTLVQGTDADYAGNPVDIWGYHPQVMFIQDKSGIPTLCRKRLQTTALGVADTECLVEGVENLQVEFGLDGTGDLQANRFELEPTSAELQDAVLARIYLLMRSISPITGYTNDRSYTLGQTTVPAKNDGYYRRVYQTTVLLRNSEAFKF